MTTPETAPALPLSTIEPTPKKKWRPGKYTPKPIVQILEMQKIVLAKVREPKLKGTSLAALIRAWCDLEERKRILRGVPLPGMLRPTDDPAQMAKRLRRHAADGPRFIELMNSAAPKGEPTAAQETKESLLPQGP